MKTKKIVFAALLFASIFLLACTTASQEASPKTGQNSAQATIARLNAIQEKADNVRNPDEPAPDFRLVDIYGKETSKQNLLGTPYILQAYASWCYSCIEEAGRVNEAYQKFKDAGLKVVYVSIWDEESNETIEEFRQRANGPKEWFWNTAQDDILLKFDFVQTDSTRIIDENGNIIYADDGPTSSQRIIEELKKIECKDNLQNKEKAMCL